MTGVLIYYVIPKNDIILPGTQLFCDEPYPVFRKKHHYLLVTENSHLLYTKETEQQVMEEYQLDILPMHTKEAKILKIQEYMDILSDETIEQLLQEIDDYLSNR